jgi:hypothetical protein
MSKPSKNADDAFFAALAELDKNTKSYEKGAIKYIAFADTIDNIISNYGYTKAFFFEKVSMMLHNKPMTENAEEHAKKFTT